MKHAKERDFLDRCYSLAVLGGTFDPIHMGHLAIADAVSRRLKPQRVLFIPSGRSAHKQDRQITNAEHRYRMTALAICGYPPFDISRLELNRPGPSYTIDTARALKAICPAGAEISFIIGADALMDILSWKDAEELLQLCKFVVVPRPGYEKDAAGYINHITAAYSAHLCWLEAPMPDISSTDIRQRFKTGQAVQSLVPKPVEDYARLHGLYTPDDAPNFETAQEALRIRLSPKRFAHTMGVVAEAERLALHYSQDINKARWAALLHDCAKEYSADKKRNLCQLWGIQLDDSLEANIDLTHSLLSAESARREFYVYDYEILQAIRYHNTGHVSMTMLDKIIMLADFVEPNRANWGPLKEMRRLAATNIDQALIKGIKYMIAEKEQAGEYIHPRSPDALKELMRSQ